MVSPTSASKPGQNISMSPSKKQNYGGFDDAEEVDATSDGEIQFESIDEDEL